MKFIYRVPVLNGPPRYFTTLRRLDKISKVENFHQIRETMSGNLRKKFRGVRLVQTR